MSKKKWIVTSILALLVIGAAVWWNFFKLESEPADMMIMDAPPMATIPAEVGEVKNIVFATGAIEGSDRKEVRAELDGKVDQVLVSKGKDVKKGDLLFTLNSEEEKISYRQQELQHNRLLKQYEEQLKEEREQVTNMVSNQSGRIKEVLVKEGEEVTAHTVVATLSPGNKLSLKGSFNGGQINYFKEGQTVEVFLPFFLSHIDGKVVNVDREGKATPEGIVAYEVEVVVENPGAISDSIEGLITHKTPDGTEIQSYNSSNFEPLADIEVKAGAAGTIKELKIKKNDELQKGMVMGLFEVKSFEMEKQEKELEIEQSRVSLEQKKRELEKYKVYAPISGEVIELNVEAGTGLDSSKPHVVISGQSDMFMKASIEERDINKIEVGQEAEVYVTAFGNEAFSGVVHEVAQQGTTAERNVRFDVKILIHEPEGLMLGMTGDSDIIIDRVENAVRLPNNVVQMSGDDEATVMIPDPETGEPSEVNVRVGLQGIDYVEIIEGLKAGDEVIIEGTRTEDEGISPEDEVIMEGGEF